MNRRNSLQKLFTGGSVIFISPWVLQSCTKDEVNDPGTNPGDSITVDLSLPGNAVLNNSGGSRVVQNVLIINAGTGFIALSAICTHQACTVAYNSVAGKIQCPCHGSEYGLSGNVLTGPAPASLHKFTVTRSGDILTITA